MNSSIKNPLIWRKAAPILMGFILLILVILILLWLQQSFYQQRDIIKKEIDLILTESIREVQDTTIRKAMIEKYGDSLSFNNHALINNRSSMSVFGFKSSMPSQPGSLLLKTKNQNEENYSKWDSMSSAQVDVSSKMDYIVIRSHVNDSSQVANPERINVFIAGDKMIFDTSMLKNKIRLLLDRHHLSSGFVVSKTKATPLQNNPSKSDQSIEAEEARILWSHTVPGGIPEVQFYSLGLQDYPSLIFGRIWTQIAFSIFAVLVAFFSFFMIHKVMKSQERLALEKSSFVSNMTHELKTPIATVGVALEALQNFHALEDLRRTEDYLQIAQSELNRLHSLVDIVIHFSMMDEGGLAMETKDIYWNQMVRNAIHRVSVLAEKNNATIKNKEINDLPPFRGDEYHLENALVNVLENAIKYSGENALINITTENSQNKIVCKIIDDGPGIESPHLNKIFDRFYRIPTGNTHTVKGYGLGLSYVKTIIESHNGEVYAESLPGKGSIFTLIIPVQYG
ncbi:MAG TPA: HAMP domain-containing sensor histidine kinase [Saprospiraceae bacterium]|nr:HAMP domain-containing sensor histidine kinase [Saprospiraceae bacterium]